MPSLPRRDFLRTGAAFGGVLLLGHVFGAADSLAKAAGSPTALVPDPQGLLDLPPGFSYVAFSRKGETMDDGLLVPAAHDGMAAFPGPDEDTVILVRNHELDETSGASAFGEKCERLSKVPAASLYDAGDGQRILGMGGTTTLVYDLRRRKLLRHHLSLAGTLRNCAGGTTPWGSWLSCEETVVRSKEGKEGALQNDHGYVFEVPANGQGLAPPVPLKAMGRFNHEAAAVDARSGVVYLTEDRGDGLLYRFVPSVKGRLAAGGRLEVLAVIGSKGLATSNRDLQAVSRGKKLEVNWVGLEDTSSPKDDLRVQGREKGAAVFARGEGLIAGPEGIYFSCTSGGKNSRGQVFRYVPSPAEGTPGEARSPGTLELYAEPDDENLLDMPDNITNFPGGGILACEDGPGENRLVGLRPDGTTFVLARTTISELTGVTFAPGRKIRAEKPPRRDREESAVAANDTTLFVNIQGYGATFAITGPWARL